MLRKALLTGLYAGIGAATAVADRLEEIGTRPEAAAPPAPATPAAPTAPPRWAPSGPQPKRAAGMQPWVVLGAAFVGGYVLAKVLDWRAHGRARN
jgi:hypothetical protein